MQYMSRFEKICISLGLIFICFSSTFMMIMIFFDPMALLRPGATYDDVLAKKGFDEVRQLYFATPWNSPETYALARRLHAIGVKACAEANDPNDSALHQNYGSSWHVATFRHANKLCAKKRTELQRQHVVSHILQ